MRTRHSQSNSLRLAPRGALNQFRLKT
jgi:hypothetical protein